MYTKSMKTYSCLDKKKSFEVLLPPEKDNVEYLTPNLDVTNGLSFDKSPDPTCLINFTKIAYKLVIKAEKYAKKGSSY